MHAWTHNHYVIWKRIWLCSAACNHPLVVPGTAGRKSKGSKTAAEAAAAAGPDDEEDFRPDSKASEEPNGTSTEQELSDARAFTSHAQKFLIKLAIAGKPVPPKVAETGQGYTLSGKPLDPTSSAARAYGLKPEVLKSEATSATVHRKSWCSA